VNAADTGEASLVPDIRAADLAWSPDGRKMALRTPDFRIAIADIASGSVRVLDTGAAKGADSSPDWQAQP
jgi:Tol biopolymer transport system component